MKKEQAAFLIGGLVFGVLLGYGLFNAVEDRPREGGSSAAAIAGPAGPPAPTQVAGGGGGAPAMVQINELKRRLEQNPGDVPALLQLGDLYRQINRWDEASGYYDRAAAVQPDNLELQLALAHASQDSGRCEQAVPYYPRVLEGKPRDPDVLTDLGVCFRSLGRFEEALEQFRSASAADPKHWQSVYNTAVVTGFDLNRHEQADEAVQRLRTLRPDSPEVGRLADSLARHREAAKG